MKYLILILILNITIISFAQDKDIDFSKIPFKKDSLWGFMNNQKQIIIPAIYDSVDFFRCNIASVIFNNMVGVIDTNGNFIIPPNYHFAEKPNNGKIVLDKYSGSIFSRYETNYESYTFNLNGKLISKKVGYTNSDYELNSVSKTVNVIIDNENYRVLNSIVNKKEYIKDSTAFKYLTNFYNGYALYFIEDKKEFGFVDLNFNKILKFKGKPKDYSISEMNGYYKVLYYYYIDGYWRIHYSGEKGISYIVLDENLEEQNPFDDKKSFANWFEHYVVDKKGNVLLKYIEKDQKLYRKYYYSYEDIYYSMLYIVLDEKNEVENEFVIAKNGDSQSGVFTPEGKTIIAFGNYNISLSNYKFLAIQKEEKCALFDFYGNQITDYIFDSLVVFPNYIVNNRIYSVSYKRSGFLKSAIIKVNNKYGLINSDGKIIIEPQYNKIKKYYFKYIVEDNGRVFYLLEDGSLDYSATYKIYPQDLKICKKNIDFILNKKYEDFKFVNDSSFFVKMNNKWGLVINEKVTIEIEQDTIFRTSDNISTYNKKRGCFLFELNGKLIFPYNSGERYTSFLLNNIKYYIKSLNNKYGIVDINGNEVLPVIYDRILSVNSDYGKVVKYSRVLDKVFAVEKRNKYAFFSSKFIQLTEFKYGNVEYDQSLDLIFAKDLRRDELFIDENGKEYRVNNPYMYRRKRSESLYGDSQYIDSVSIAGSKTVNVYLNNRGILSYPLNDPRRFLLQDIKNNIILKEYKYEKYKMLDSLGRYRFPKEIDSKYWTYFINPFWCVMENTNNNEQFVIDKFGNEIIQPGKYKIFQDQVLVTDIDDFQSTIEIMKIFAKKYSTYIFVSYESNGKEWGHIINPKGEVITSKLINRIYGTYNNKKLFKVFINDKGFYIDINGNEYTFW